MSAIEVIVNSQGESRIQTVGFAGSVCRVASRLLEQSLGVVTDEQLTSEFHQSPVTETRTTSEHSS